MPKAARMQEQKYTISLAAASAAMQQKNARENAAAFVRALFFPEGGLRTVSAAYSALLSASSMGIFRMRRKSKIVTMA